MSTTRKTPKLRFPEFTGDWEQRELGEIAEKVTKKNSNLEISETFTNSAEQGIISQKDFFDHKVASSENIGNYYVVDKNDFVYNPRISTTAPVGPINRNRLGRAGVMSPLYTVFRAKDINQLFLEWYFKSSCWHLFMYFNGDSGARSDRFSIKDSVFFSMPIFVPSKEEQFKIGRFFDQLNETITLHQRELDSLKKLKKSLLQKMFPKNGEKIPELRFPEFTGDWEQRKLSDISERVTRKNKNLEYSLPLTISAQYGLVDQHEFFNKRIAAKDVSGYYVIKNGEFAYNKSYSEGYPWGAVKRLDRYKNGVLSTLYILFSVKNVNSDFLVSDYDTNNWHSEVQQRSAEGARNHGLLNISASDFFDTALVIPQDPNEQKKIGLLFKKLDSTITLHQRELDTLKKLKKGLLQNMFV